MMGLGTFGGNSSSSTSNLSALAPPFTVDRLNPKSHSNPLSLYPDSSYAVESFSQPWQYAHPSAPLPESVIDSTGIGNDYYRFSASPSITPSSTQLPAINSGAKAMGSAFSYGGEVKPYHSPYVPPLVGEDSLLVENEGSRYNALSSSGLNAKSQNDYTQSLYDLEHGPSWVDSGGFNGGKRVKASEHGGSFSAEKANVGSSYSYTNQPYQGGHGGENRRKSKEDSGVLYQSLNQVSSRESCSGSRITECMEDKACLEQNFGSPYNSNRTLAAATSLPYLESHASVISCEMQKNFPHYQNSCSPYEKCLSHVDTPFPGRASVIRASPTVVIRPPPATKGSLKQSNDSRKPSCVENIVGSQSVDFDYSNKSKPKDSGLQLSSKVNEESSERNIFNFPMQGNGLISSTSVKEQSSPLPSRGTSDRKIKARHGSQATDINVYSGLSVAVDNVPVVNLTMDSSDITDHHNTVVDSPCWKGAPSQFSPFDIEAGNSYHAKVNLDESCGFGLEEHQKLHSMVDSDRVFSGKAEDLGKENESARNGVALAFDRTLDRISTKEQSLFDGARDTVWTSPLTRCKGVGSSDGPNMLHKESILTNNLTSVFDIKVSEPKHSIGKIDTVVTVNDASEGAAIAVHAAEKVLDSPASQEDAVEHTVVPDPTLNVGAMIKTIHNLSELLLFHLSSDACSLDEENTETLKHVISNLDSSLTKKVVHPTSKQDLNNNPMEDTSEILRESPYLGTISGGPPVRCVAGNSHIRSDYQRMHERKDYSVSGKKDEKSRTFSSPRDDLDTTGIDDMTKAIKKVLDENFQLNEEMPSQALLFKSLWLEAEAKLCSISYKARFDRMKIEMEETKDKTSQENEDNAEMTSQMFFSPDPITVPEQDRGAHDGISLDTALQNASISSTYGLGEEADASVLARFNILRSRDNKLKPASTEEEQQPEIIDGDAGSNSIMARYNILKSREGNSKSIIVKEEKQPKIIDSEFAGEKYLRPFIRGQLEDETLIVSQKPHQTGDLNNSKFDSYKNGAGYESLLNEHHLSVTNDPTILPFKSSMLISERNLGSCGSSSSDWEHVLKDDFSWKNA